MVEGHFSVQVALVLQPQRSPTFLLLSETAVKRVLPRSMTFLATVAKRTVKLVMGLLMESGFTH